MNTPTMTREPVRLPVWAGLILAAVLAGLTTLQASGSWLAAVIAALAVVTPGGISVEVARSHAWAPTSVHRAATVAAMDAAEAGGPGVIDVDELLARAQAAA